MRCRLRYGIAASAQREETNEKKWEPLCIGVEPETVISKVDWPLLGYPIRRYLTQDDGRAGRNLKCGRLYRKGYVYTYAIA